MLIGLKAGNAITLGISDSIEKGDRRPEISPDPFKKLEEVFNPSVFICENPSNVNIPPAWDEVRICSPNRVLSMINKGKA